MRHSIKNKVLLAILVVTLVTAGAITLVFYFKSAEMIEENYGSSLYSRVRQTVLSFDDAMREVYYANVKASCDAELSEVIREYQETRSGLALDRIAEKLRDYRSSGHKDLAVLYFVFAKERTAVTSEDYPIRIRDIAREDIDKMEQASKQDAGPVMMADIVHDTGKQLAFIQTVADEDGVLLGYLMAGTNERTLFYKYLEPVCDGKVTQALIMDKDKQIVTGMDYEKVGQVWQDTDTMPVSGGLDSRTSDKIKILYQGAFSRCGLYMEIPKSEVLKDLQQMQVFLAILFGLVLLCGAILAGQLTKALYRPIKTMSEAVEQVGQGDLSVRAEVNTRDEIGTLSWEFNRMLDSVEELIERVVDEERQKKDAELEALQYQITPHFMYNTLNSIKFAALIKGEQEIGTLIGDFVELLQASINKKGTFITVADEMHILENYIHLQKFRYQGSFDVEYDVDEKAWACYIPRLILQPLVENAILHGIDMKKGNGRLVVRGQVEASRLLLYVIDNGHGMTAAQIDVLLHGKTSKTNGLSGIGVANVRERLKLYYGEQGGITYESHGHGTTAFLYMPVKYEADI